MFVVNEFSTVSSEQISGFLFYTRRPEHCFWKHFLKNSLFSQYFLLKSHHFSPRSAPAQLCGGGLPTLGFISLWDWRCICCGEPDSHNLKAAWAVLDTQGCALGLMCGLTLSFSDTHTQSQ